MIFMQGRARRHRAELRRPSSREATARSHQRYRSPPVRYRAQAPPATAASAIAA